MKAKGKKIPRFQSEAEEAEFWSTHDSSDYWQDLETVLEPVELDSSLKLAIDRRAPHGGRRSSASDSRIGKSA